MPNETRVQPKQTSFCADFVCKLLSNVVTLFGGLSLLGWILELPKSLLTGIHPGAGLCLILLGVSLRAECVPKRGMRKESLFCVWTSLLLSGLTLLAHSWPTSFARQLVVWNAHQFMNYSSACELFLLSLGMLATDTDLPFLRRFGEVILLIAFSYAVYALVFALGDPAYSELPVPALKSLALVLLALGILIRRVHNHYGEVLSASVFARTSVTIAAILIVGISAICTALHHYGVFSAMQALAFEGIAIAVAVTPLLVQLSLRHLSTDAKLQTVTNELEQSERKQHLTFDRFNEACVSVDSSSRIIEANLQLERLIHQTADDLVRREIYGSLIPNEERHKFENIFSAKEEPGPAELANGYLIESQLLTKEGKRVPVELSITRLSFEDNTVIFYMLFRDITNRLKIAKDLEVASQKALQSARLKSEFLANMSHEIRTPLNGIIGLSDILVKRSLPDDIRDLMNTINVSANSLLSIVNDVLDYSKIEAGKLHIEEFEFDIVSLVEESTDIIADTARERGLSLSSFISPSLSENYRGDAGRIRQVLLNFLSNAVKFTQSGEVFVFVTLEKTSQDIIWVEFSVTDTGIGISEEQQENIFEPFTQADGSMTRVHGGTGLGLSISKRLVELMKGKIGVDSKVGEGSTFWFTVPLHKPARRPCVRKTRKFFEDVRILFLNGSTHATIVLEEYATSWGIQCVRLDKAEAALQLLRRRAAEDVPFDLVVMDTLLTPHEVFSIAESIRQFPEISKTPLVLLTSQPTPATINEAKDLGFAEVLVKPIKQSRFNDCIVEVISGLARIDNSTIRSARGAANPQTSEPPAEQTPVRVTTPEVPVAQLTSSFQPPSQVGRILLAEDNAVNQKVAMLQLQQLGYQVKAVQNGAEALSALEEEDFALILMDCQMPELDGFETTRRIRELEESNDRHIPIIAMTAHALAEDRQKCIAAGMDDYLSKPVKADILKKILDRYLNGKDAAGPGTSTDHIAPALRMYSSAPHPEPLDPF